MTARRARLVALVALLASTGSGPSVGREGAAGADDERDADNALNRRFDDVRALYVPMLPRTTFVRRGDRAGPPAGVETAWCVLGQGVETARLRGGSTLSFRPPASWTLDERHRAASVRGAPDRFAPHASWTSHPPWVGDVVPWTSDGRRHELVVALGSDRARVMTDALPVVVLVERRTLADGDRRFGSFVRRVRESLDEWNRLAARSRYPFAPAGVVDRFRIDDVIVYARENGLPDAFRAHPEAALAIAFDERGPGEPGLDVAAVSILVTAKGIPRGIWSARAERVLWRELLRSRGIPDLRRTAIRAGALPGRLDAPVAPPAPVSKDLLLVDDGPAVVSETSAVLANANRGVGLVGDPDDVANVRFGPTWSWLPPRIDVVLSKGGSPAAGLAVRVWRSRPTGPDGAPGVAADAPPDLALVTDTAGKVSLLGMDFGRTLPRAERSLWLLVEVELDGGRRFEIVYGFALNAAYARGDKYGTTLRWDLDRMIPRGGAVPDGR